MPEPTPTRARGRGRGRGRGGQPPVRPPQPTRDWTDPQLLRYPAELPVVERRDDILAAIRDHQVVVIAGETGSGKTTQIPKMCLELGRGRTGQIGHTQPRRIAARSVAERLAQELDVEIGADVGYQVRFTAKATRATAVKVMTDGILLSEMQRDRDLRRYDTIIIDEAHERSLNIDFILGYLKRLLPRRPDLKVIVTSATIDPQRFAAHFAAPDGTPAPIIEVSGRTFPVEIRYRPLAGEDTADDAAGEPHDQVAGIVDAVSELWTEPDTGGPRDVLVFLSGEREIRDAADALAGANLPGTEVLPLYARLSAAEQHRVFAPHTGRRIVLATNVAETSLTVPGIRYVVDTGTARISRWSARTKVQRLPIEPVSQASANQRAGRCGRVADGICIRLYSQDDFAARPEFTDPEIQRTSLASVILQMTALGLGDVARFPFVDPPDSRQVADGLRLLEELQAVGETDERRGGRRLTDVGRALARLPLDPRMGRMLVEADRLGCVAEVLVIVAALSIQDPRERPVDKKEQADQAHARFAREHSDFASYLALWRYLRQQQRALSGSAFRRMCQREYLHYLRVREWQDLHTQLRAACEEHGIDPSAATAERDAEPDWDRIHQALLSGLLSHVGVRDEQRRDYLGARGARFSIQPGSALFRRQPAFVVSAELVETTKVWARTNARIDPAWAERLGAHVVKRQHSEPRWSRGQAAAVATERVTLYGVPLATDRTVQLARIDPALARELFIRHALVVGDWDTRHEVIAHNRALVEDAAELEERSRRRGLVADDEAIMAFYDTRIPASVVSGRHFDSWWKTARRTAPDLLTLTEDVLLTDAAGEISGSDFPRTWRSGELELSLTYRFDPSAPDDGVTVHIPVAVLNQVPDTGFDRLVPGVREDLLTALIKTLPKPIRRHVVPAPDHARAACAEIARAEAARPTGPDGPDHADDEPLVVELARILTQRAGVPVSPHDLDPERLPAHLRMTYAVEDGGGRVLGSGKDLAALRQSLGGHLQNRVSRAGRALERAGLTSWTIGELPRTFASRTGGHEVVGYPALVDEGESVAVRVLAHESEAVAAHRRGVRRLLVLGTTPPWKRVLSHLDNAQKAALAHNPHGSVPALLQDCLEAAVDDIVGPDAEREVHDDQAFAAALSAVRTHAAARVLAVVRGVQPVLAAAGRVTLALDAMGRRTDNAVLRATAADVRAQLGSLVRPGFVAATGLSRLPDLERYLAAMEHRLTRAAANPREDVLQATVDRVEERYADLLDALPATAAATDEVRAIATAIEELRVSLFAQHLGTNGPVSEKRVLKAIDAVRGEWSLPPDR